MTTLDALTLLIAGGSLWVAVAAYREARRAPVKQAQRELREQAREHLQTIEDHFRSVQMRLEFGEDVGAIPDVVPGARVSLSRISDRVEGLEVPLDLAVVKTRAATERWSAARFTETSLAAAKERLENWRGHEFEREYADQVDSYERKRTDERVAVREQVAGTLSYIDRVRRDIDAADKRE